MSFLRPSATKQTTSSVGAGSLVLNVNTGDTRSFQTALGSGPIKCRYMLRGQGYFEMGRGTFTAPSALTRDEALITSNANALVSIPAGTTDVYLLDYAQFVVDSFSGTTKTLANADASNTWVFTGSSASVLTLPAISASLPDFFGFVRNAGTATLTLTAPGSDVIDETGTQTVVLYPGDAGFVFLDTANSKWRIARSVAATTVLLSSFNGSNLAASYAQVAAVALTPGKWRLSAAATVIGTVSATYMSLAISTTTASSTGSVDGITKIAGSINAVSVGSAVIPAVDITVAANTTYFLNINGNGTGTAALAGNLRAERIT